MRDFFLDAQKWTCYWKVLLNSLETFKEIQIKDEQSKGSANNKMHKYGQKLFNPQKSTKYVFARNGQNIIKENQVS